MKRENIEDSLRMRIKSIEGHLKKVESMVADKDNSCDSILSQTHAIECALKSLDRQIIANHFKSCFCDEGMKCEKHDLVIDELVEMLDRR